MTVEAMEANARATGAPQRSPMRRSRRSESVPATPNTVPKTTAFASNPTSPPKPTTSRVRRYSPLRGTAVFGLSIPWSAFANKVTSGLIFAESVALYVDIAQLRIASRTFTI